VKNPLLLHGASSKEKAVLAIHPRSPERGMPAFSRQHCSMAISQANVSKEMTGQPEY